MTLSVEARSALINTAPRVGACVRVAVGSPTFDELRAHGLISGSGNLTRSGAIMRERVIDATLEAM